jgi:hypothetical protein
MEGSKFGGGTFSKGTISTEELNEELEKKQQLIRDLAKNAHLTSIPKKQREVAAPLMNPPTSSIGSGISKPPESKAGDGDQKIPIPTQKSNNNLQQCSEEEKR